ncbi:MAG: hypothetical protein C5B52_08350 [Bacteroidetes bacterium]|nr:MAG: hypothetical protein C5B52_08350 [Bacteroidota bacterium]
MNSFIKELRKRNSLLYFFGAYNFAAVIICAILIQFDTRTVLGIDVWIKPLKFFLSVGILSWTMAWYLDYLTRKKAVKRYSRFLVFSLFCETSIISLQSARGIRSHFNLTSPLNSILFNIMGVLIAFFVLYTAYICYLFFKQKQFNLPMVYVWGIRIGLIFFIIFSFEGGVMVRHLGHTVGGEDGGPGIPLLNWSTLYGDLRIAHFLGMHSLQIIPFCAYYITKTKASLIILSLIYLLVVSSILVISLRGISLV